VALEKLDGCSDAFVDPVAGITLLFSKAVEVEEKALQTMLTPFKIEVQDLKKVEKPPY
jgi:hypothetical protein